MLRRHTMKYYKRRWEALPLEKGSSSIIERVLLSRGIEDCDLFLNPPPFTKPLPGSDQAVPRLCTAINNRENICIIGDYDVDGISSSALLSRFLRHHGLSPVVLLPHRYEGGYGLSENIIARIPDDTDLIITVDCGISDMDAVSVLMKKMDVIITDHHEPKETIPPASAVVNPRLDPENFPLFSGSGVIYHLLLSTGLSMPSGTASLCMLGTIADLMPLIGENRRIVKEGLRELYTDPIPGLLYWLEQLSLDARDVRSDDISFRLAPLLNAPGRLGSPDPAFVLLNSDDPQEIQEAFQNCLYANEDRKTLTTKMMEDIVVSPEDSAILHYHSDWKIGLVGLAASQATEMTGLPAIFFSLEGDILVGSGRAPEGFHLLEALTASKTHLIRYGGHRHAAGLQLHISDYGAFREQFLLQAKKHPPQEVRETFSYILLKHTEVGIYLLDELEKLEPFGQANEPIYFLLRNMKLTSVRPMGRTGKAYSLIFSKAGADLRFVNFSGIGEKLLEGEFYDVLFQVKRNVFRGVLSMQLQLVDLRHRHILPSFYQPFFIPYYEDLMERVRGYNPKRQTKQVLLPLTRIEMNGEEYDFTFTAEPIPSLNSLIDPQQRLQEGFINLLPNRDSLIRYYRELKAGVPLDWRDPIIAAQRFFAIKIFEELGIISYTKHNDQFNITFYDGDERFRLEDSLFYRQATSILEAWSETYRPYSSN
ncbi:MAG: hypothetical protein GX260_02700 [Tissierellia bacterium]|nr:hypothetical protein [Tissierellia bacterium]